MGGVCLSAVRAATHDHTIRAEFERYCQTCVDIEGRLLGFDPQATTADPDKHRLSRASDILPNGYCGRPPQQDCPHPNACLTCRDFQTTVELLPIHREQAAADTAGRSGWPPTAAKSRSTLTRSSSRWRTCAAPARVTMTDHTQQLCESAPRPHDDALRRAQATLRTLARRDEPVTVRSVADAARVSRSWLYRQPHLLAEIHRLRQPRSNSKPSVPANQRATIECLRHQLHAYREQITRLRAEITDLNEQLARHIGAARTAAIVARS